MNYDCWDWGELIDDTPIVPTITTNTTSNMNFPKRVHEEWDGYVMEWPDDGRQQERFYAYEFAAKVPKGHGKIMLADNYKGKYRTMEEAKSHIL